jgi:hypothetical protein
MAAQGSSHVCQTRVPVLCFTLRLETMNTERHPDLEDPRLLNLTSSGGAHSTGCPDLLLKPAKSTPTTRGGFHTTGGALV